VPTTEDEVMPMAWIGAFLSLL